ncbi:MAG TPA: T9SS type A sorting domain-containing protein, partial [Candidatus Syntrophosphaera sp.]|nr:T9SS type A sorting domain-containing protein [Candidatus Syntrophosphaera sp.]
RGTFSVETTRKSPFNLALYDLRGRELFSIRNLSSFQSAEHALNLAAGVYFLRLEAEGGSQLKRLAVIK